MKFLKQTLKNKHLFFSNLNSFLLCFFIMYFLFPGFSFLGISTSIFHKIVPIFLFLVLSFSLLKTKFSFSPTGAFYALAFLFFSNFLNRDYALVQGPIIKGEIILFALISFLLLLHRKEKWLFILSFLAPIFLLCIFLYESKKGMIWSDDNPTFLYRLSLLKDFSPNIPFFYTRWNAGLDARDFFATGALNVFLLSYPIVKFLDITKYFNLIHSYILFVLLPGSVFFSCKILKKNFKFTCIALTLCVSTSLFWYRWALKYGTLGFITSTSLLILVFTLSQKFLTDNENLNKKEAVALVIATTLMLLWSPTGLVFIPTIIFALFKLKNLIHKKYFFKIILSLFIINLPIILIFLSVSKVGSFLSVDKNKPSKIAVEAQDSALAKPSKITVFQNKIKGEISKEKLKETNQKALKNIREAFVAINPLIILFSLLGAFCLPKTFKKLYLLTAVWLLFLASIVSIYIPQLELNRMIIILGLLSIFPVSALMEKFLEEEISLQNYILEALFFSFIFAGMFSTGKILKNKSIEVFYRQDENIKNLVNFLKNYETENRVLFSGFVLHHFSQGHIAPLPILTNKNIIASTPFHNVWKYTEVLPIEFLKNNNIKGYLDLMNIELVIAHEKKWRDYFLNNKEDYELIYEFNNYKIFKYKNLNPSFIYSGIGNNLKVNKNNISFTPQSEEVVLKFNFYPFLKSNNCNLESINVSESISFIKLTHCEIGKETKIDSKNAFKRVFAK